MSQNPVDWDTDIPHDPQEEYQALLRALRRKRGFGLFFVECSARKSNELIAKLQQDLPQKTTQIMQFDRATTTLYDCVETLWNQQSFDILFLQGLENALYKYEDTKRAAGWTSREVYLYSWKGVPRILSHLNQQRERFRDSFDCCFVFFIPFFVTKYLIQRAPDFFDWRSGLFIFPMEATELQQESQKIQFNREKSEKYAALSPQDRKQKILEISNLINQEHQSTQGKAALLCEQAFLWQSLQEYEQAVICYDKVVEIEPNNSVAWFNRGVALEVLGRQEEARESWQRSGSLDISFESKSFEDSSLLDNSEVTTLVVQKSHEMPILRGVSNETVAPEGGIS
jgi:tetratricopeptide (TPR) repeat protein